ncbi:MAG: AraC family transcriptional regulator [Acidimicrobiales bacterium]|nr:MAG: AraC family transcriptional regulator [Acidimicrobiales bacterium]
MPGAVLWERTLGPTPEHKRILPDGCMDILWDGRRLSVAGPDSTARLYASRADAFYVALRFSGGLGPALLGVSADELRDQTAALEDLWPSVQTRALTDQVAADSAAALQAWVAKRAASYQMDAFGPRVLKMAMAGTSVAAMADRLGVSCRQLHRRCLPIFGYGPRHLARVLRMGRALEETRWSTPLAQVAADCGYADQAHLSREVRALAGMTPTGLLQELRRS